DQADLFTVAHEAAHVVQQRGGVQLRGGVGEQGDPYEQHANEVAALVVQGKSAEAVLDRSTGGPGAAPADPRAGRAARRVVPVAATRRTGTTMLAMTLGELERYTQSQVDWHSNNQVSAQQHDELRSVLELATGDASLSGGCRGMVVSTLVPVIADGAQRRAL